MTLTWREDAVRRLMRERRGLERESDWQRQTGPSSSQRYRTTHAQQDDIFTQNVDQLPWVNVVSRTADS